MNPDDLLDIAEHLARMDPGRPKQVSLRRAISTAYYAVFHALAYLSADELVGWKSPRNAFTPVYRALDHAAARRAFERDRDGQIHGREVAEIGRIFALLQQERNAADYHPQYSSTREKTLELIRLARKAVQSTLGLSGDTRRLLAVHLIVRQR